METHLHPLPALSDDPPPPPLATGKRIRRRARDVSSRYMATTSPLSAPSSPIHHFSSSSSFGNPRHHNPKPRIPTLPSSSDATDSESEHSSHYADENQCSFDTPIPLGAQCKPPNTRQRRVVRLFSDNISDTPQTQILGRTKCTTDSRSSHCRPKIGTLKPAICRTNQLRSINKTGTHEGNLEALTPFPLSNDVRAGNSSALDHTENCTISSQGGQCQSPPIRSQVSCRKQASELRSSMPEADSLPTSSRMAGTEQRIFRRSLNSAMSSCQLSPFNLMNVVNNKISVDEICNFRRNFCPPEQLGSRLGLDLKKGKKGSSRKEDTHVLHLLHNQYLQWRFVNAKEKVASKARVTIAERSLSDVSEKLKELRGSVIEKRMELEKLKTLRRVSNIIDLEMPYLEEWALADGENYASVSGMIKALQDASIRLPIIGDVRVDVRELEDAINSLTWMFESFSPTVRRFLPMVDEVVKFITELAKVASREKALIEECGGLLSQVQGLQIKECSFRSMLMQEKSCSTI